ncbi:carbon starvation CstA family protein, partial [Yersinia pestis PY-16]
MTVKLPLPIPLKM